MLKSTTGWKNDNGTDDFGFSALPAGCRYRTGHFGDDGAYFWSSTDSYRMDLDHDGLTGRARADLHAVTVGTDEGLSVRCVKD